MSNPTSLWPSLLSQVEAHDGVYKTTVGFLRQIAGAQRMGPNIADRIESGLEIQGLRAFPEDLNRTQDEPVILIKAGTLAYQVFRAIQILEPTDDLVDALTRLNTLPKDPNAMVPRAAVREAAEGLVDKVTELLGIASPYQDPSEDGHPREPKALLPLNLR